MLSSLFVTLFCHSIDIVPLVWSIPITIVAEAASRLLDRNADNLSGRCDAYFIVTISWMFFTVFGTLPFMVGGYIGSFTDTFLKTISGFTTTGATAIDYSEHLPRGILFWRSLAQWIGGLGIIFSTITILPSMVGGSVKILATEAIGPIKSKLHPRLSTSTKWIWVVYLVLTISYTLSYKVCGMGWFDAFNYPMTSAVTGGFLTGGDFIATFHSPVEEYVYALFYFLSGTNLTLLYASMVELGVKKLLKNSGLRFYTITVFLFTIFIPFGLVYRNHYEIEHAFHSALFRVVSLVVATRLSNDDTAKWSHVIWVVLAACMFFGGCSGSTGGSIKGTRGVMLLKAVYNEFRQILRLNAVLPTKVGGVDIPQLKHVTLLGSIGLYLVSILLCAFTMTVVGTDNTNAITTALSSLGNVGPTLGMEIGPTMSWAQLPNLAKWIRSFLTLVDCLELFTVLVLFSPAFWKEDQGGKSLSLSYSSIYIDTL